MSVHHAMKTNSPSMCQPHHKSICHTNIMTSPSVCPSKQSSDSHTTSKTSPSVCQSCDSSVCNPSHDEILPTIWQTVCLSSVTSVLPSANPMVKIPTSVPVRNFLHYQIPGKIPFVRTSTESSVNHPDSPSINSRHCLPQTRRNSLVIMARTPR